MKGKLGQRGISDGKGKKSKDICEGKVRAAMGRMGKKRGRNGARKSTAEKEGEERQEEGDEEWMARTCTEKESG